jgi:hypothetical protein
VALAVALSAIGAGACSDSGSSTGSTSAPGNTVIDDTRDAEPRPPANPDPGDGATVTGEPDATYDYGEGGSGGDATTPPPASYPGIAECSSCSCPGSTAYCFGGATPRMASPFHPQGTADAGADAGAPPCPMVPTGALGCTPLPAGSTDCASLIASLQATYACYLVCAFDGNQMSVYCPNP